jgi:membrane protein DedA with SNARE-associated domain
LRRPLLIVLAVVCVPIFPLLLLGLSFEDKVTSFVHGANLSAAGKFWLIVGVLSSDIFLPIPSSAVSTWGGGVLGLWPATLAASLGTTIGSVIGFACARLFGDRFARWRAGRDLDRASELSRRLGPPALLVTRALPILAEACVLLVGVGGLTWRRFLPPVIVGNVVVSFAYAACGRYFAGSRAMPWVIIASGTVPLLIAVAMRRRLGRSAEDAGHTDRPIEPLAASQINEHGV